MTTKTKNSRKNVTNPRRIRDESYTSRIRVVDEPQTIRYAFAPLLQQFRAHTRKNEARLWIPIETSLLTRYEFAALSPQTRYIFVAILLYCGANGIDEIPLDAKFMSNVLVADSRTIEKSFEELLFAKLLQERIEREEKKEQTDRQETALDARVCVTDLNSFQNENQSENGLVNKSSPDLSLVIPKHSQFSIEECLRYVEACQAKGEQVQSPKALASKLSKTGEADSFIRATLYPEQFNAETFGVPIQFTDEPCAVCFGAKMESVEGKGARRCEHCRNERGKSTGLEPEGEHNQ